MICNNCNAKMNVFANKNQEYSLWCNNCAIDISIKQGNIYKFYMFVGDFERISSNLTNSRYWKGGNCKNFPPMFPLINNDVLEVKEYLDRIRKLKILL